MITKQYTRRTSVALLLLVAFFSQATWTLAGTTGRLSGTVIGEGGSPVAAATIKVSSPSQTASTTTDAGGHFTFLSLAPDTYVVSASKEGYQPASDVGTVVFADQSITVSVTLQRSLKNIASVTSRTASSLVKSGNTGDVYSVNAATQAAVAGIGGGGNIDSAYSAIYSQPGVNSQMNNYGFGQVFYIRGSSYSQVGYEYDGVPVNRSFDNYNANSLSNLGSQETEVYTGGSPASGTASTLAGYINQVIKTGTFPGYANLNGGVGYPGFYHKAGVEAGGSTPDRNFSYYVGIQGADQTYRTLNNQDGGNLSTDGSNGFGLFSASIISYPTIALSSPNGPWSTCQGSHGAPAGSASYQGFPSCAWYAPFQAIGLLVGGKTIGDRENVVNTHFGIPHHNDSGKDDVQLLFYNFSYHTTFGDSIDDNGGMANINDAYAGWNGLFGPKLTGPYANYCAFEGIFGFTCASGPSPVPYLDGNIFVGASFSQNAANAKVGTYLAPSSPTDRAPDSGIPANVAGTIWNDGTVLKLQYQKNIGSNAFVRLMGYTFYSDWLMNNQASAPAIGANALYAGFTGFSSAATDYELATHSRGAQFDAEDQINPQNLLTLTGNYTTGTAVRTNNEYWFLIGGGVTNLVAGNQCFDAKTGKKDSCFQSASQGTYQSPLGPFANGNTACANLPGTPACSAGAAFEVTTPGGYGPINSVQPQFSSVALQDQWRPSDRWLVNVGVRYENYTYDLANMNTPEFTFWFAQARNTYCYDPGTGQPVLVAVTPATPPSATGPVIDPNTLAGQQAALCYQPGTLNPLVAPSGQQAKHPLNFTNLGQSNQSYTLFSPRVSGTYTFDPDTVVRFNAGRFSEPAQVAYSQYSNLSGFGAAKTDFQYFYGLGFDTPQHNNPPQTSNNYDMSFEKHLKGTDWSFKVSPFFRDTQNQVVTVSLGGTFASGINAAQQLTSGVEVAVQKGDPSRNGLSGQLSYTYTDAKQRFYTLSNGSNTIDNLNNFIRAYNGLTGFCAAHAGSSQCPSGVGAASPCYNPASPTGPNGSNAPVACGADPGKSGFVINPYYNQPVAPLFDRNGWYPIYANNPPDTAPDLVPGAALSPNVFSGFLNYKHDRFAVAVPVIFQQGLGYGSPTAIVGVDPRSCSGNEAHSKNVLAGIGPQFAGLPDYQTCGPSLFTPSANFAIPDPQTHQFDALGAFTQPWQLNLSLQLAYDISPRVRATLTVANLVNTCFGGSSEPWTKAYPPGQYDCAYLPNGYSFVGGAPGSGYFYGANGRAPQNGTAGYPNWFNQAYYPSAGVAAGASPIQLYGNIQIRL